MPPVAFTESQKRELAALPRLGDLPAEQLVACSHRQLSLLSTLPLGSVAAALARELRPAVPGSNAFRAGELAKFCEKHAQATATRVALAAVAGSAHEFADPADMAKRYILGLLGQTS